MSTFTLADLAAIIDRRAESADPASSYTARLLADGIERAARKFGEESIEAVVAALKQDDRALTGEAADVLFHLLVVLKARNISLDAVMAELESRTRQSGLQEKAARGKA
jgi:phosphoribosyl-ATP pyrophosphohydrolase